MADDAEGSPIVGVARAKRYPLVLPATAELADTVALDVLIAPACGQASSLPPLVLYVLDPEPVLFGAACLAVYAGSGYYATVAPDTPESRYERIHVVGIGHARDSFAATPLGWDAPALRTLRRRDFPPWTTLLSRRGGSRTRTRVGWRQHSRRTSSRTPRHSSVSTKVHPSAARSAGPATRPSLRCRSSSPARAPSMPTSWGRRRCPWRRKSYQCCAIWQ